MPTLVDTQTGQPVQEFPYTPEGAQQLMQLVTSNPQIMEGLNSGALTVQGEQGPMTPDQIMAMAQGQAGGGEMSPGAGIGDMKSPGVDKVMGGLMQGMEAGNVRPAGGPAASPPGAGIPNAGGPVDPLMQMMANTSQGYQPGQQPTAVQANQRGMYGQ
mgnify:CR=1 FL=1